MDGAGAEPGTRVVRVPSLPDLWGVGISGVDRSLEAGEGRRPPPDTPHPRAPKRSASLGHPPPSPAFLKLQASEFCSSAPSTAPPHFFARPEPSGPQLTEAPLQAGFSPGGRRSRGWCSHTRRGAHRWSRSGCGLSDTRSPRRRAARKGSTMGCSD